MVMYRNSKLCQVLCMLTLAASLEKDDAVNVNAVSIFMIIYTSDGVF